MGRHKFMILALDAEYILEALDGVVENGVVIADKIRSPEDPCIRFVECHHENFGDNLVTFKVGSQDPQLQALKALRTMLLQGSAKQEDMDSVVEAINARNEELGPNAESYEEYELLRDVNGDLWNFDIAYDKKSVAKAFEINTG